MGHYIGVFKVLSILVVIGSLLIRYPDLNVDASAGNFSETADTENAISDLLRLKNYTIDANVITPANITIQENVTRAGILDYDGLGIPILYQPLGNGSNIEAAGLFEGDILLGKKIVGGRAAHDSFITTSRWTNGVIHVWLDPQVPNRNDILDAMIYLIRNTPITFKPVTIHNGNILDRNYVAFFPSNEICESNLGMQGGTQYVFVSPSCKFGPLIHELGHTIGMWHEQTRCDRDKYIDVIETNIRPGWESQFNAICDPTRPERSPLAFGEYDYCSIMHYPLFGRQSSVDPSKPIMVPLKEVTGCNERDIGKYIGLSPQDKAAIEALY
jgi:hypothetical protein